MPTITGTTASELLTGTADADLVQDELGGSDTLKGLGGNDVIHIYRAQYTGSDTILAEGGDGDDLIDYYVFNHSVAVLDGGAGADVFRLWATAGFTQIITGAGSDVISFDNYNPTWGGSLSVADFTGGTGGDRITWGSAPAWPFTVLSGWDGGNPFASGHLTLTQVDADAVLWMDLDGSAGPGAAFALLTFSNTEASTLTTWNLGFDPAGGPIPGQTINGTTAGDNLQGTVGNDIITGQGGDDILSGGRGDDSLDGGAGNDFLSGDQGTDILVGGDGDDSLSAYGEDLFGTSFGNDTLSGGGGNDYITVARWGQVADVVTASGGVGSDEFHVIGDGVFSAILDGGADADQFYLDGHIRANLTLTTGAGPDTIRLGMIIAETQAITVTDFTAGAGGDVVAWGSALDFYLTGWNLYNPFQLGFARLVQDGTNVLLQLDRDGSAAGETWKTLFIFQNTLVASFTAENLLYSPNVVPGQLYNGTDGADVFNGTDGNDVIHGQGGNDTLQGGAGDDELRGGGGRDILIGGSGNDTIDGGMGGEEPTGYVNGVYTSGGDLLDFRDAGRGVTVDLSLSGVQQNTGLGLDTFSWIEDVFGSQFDDVITGDRFSAGLIMGNGGDDVLAAGYFLVGGEGDDTLIATFQCTMDGGTGEDTAVFEAARGDYVIAAGADGTVTVTRFGVLTYITRDVEILQFSDGLYDINGVKLPTIVNGTPNADTLNGGDESDLLNGGDGDDVLTGGFGDDTANGGNGTDTAMFSGARSLYTLSTTGGVTTVTGPDGVDVLTGVERLMFADGVYQPNGSPYVNPVAGTPNGDVLNGTPFADSMTGLGANDTLNGLGGNDLLNGGAGADSMAGGLGDDFYTVDNAGDVAVELAGQGNDRVTSSVTWTASAGAEIETITTSNAAGAGAIWLTGSDTANTILGNAGDNRLFGQGGNDQLSGLDGADRLYGGTGVDVLGGGAGADTLDGGAGADTLVGGLGDDFYYVDDPFDTIVEAAGQGTDRIFAAVSYVLAAGADVEQMSTLSAAGTEAIWLTGSNLNNTITGNAGDNRLFGMGGIDQLSGLDGTDRLYGGDGQDVLSGGAGDDIVDGGTGSDTLVGGLGDDFYYVDDQFDVIVEAAGQGNDRVFAAASFVLGAGADIEQISTTSAAGTTAINLTGSNLNNAITGNAGANSLTGLDGNDSLAGLDGNDRLYGGNGVDSLSGGVGADLLDGGAGADTFVGGLGDDFYYVDSLLDAIFETAGQGADRVFASASYVLAAAADIETLSTANAGATTAIDLTGNGLANLVFGNEGANVLRGMAGADSLFGAGGNDRLEGGTGNDALSGGAGNDVYAFAVGGGADILTETSGSDTLEIGGALTTSDLVWQVVGSDLYVGLRNPGNPGLVASQCADRVRIVGGAVEGSAGYVETVTVGGQTILVSDMLVGGQIPFAEPKAEAFDGAQVIPLHDDGFVPLGKTDGAPQVLPDVFDDGVHAGPAGHGGVLQALFEAMADNAMLVHGPHGPHLLLDDGSLAPHKPIDGFWGA